MVVEFHMGVDEIQYSFVKLNLKIRKFLKQFFIIIWNFDTIYFSLKPKENFQNIVFLGIEGTHITGKTLHLSRRRVVQEKKKENLARTCLVRPAATATGTLG